jgi:hypothetical protein
MSISKTGMYFSDVPAKLYRVDTIVYEGRPCIVPEWLDNPLGGWRKPARLICLDGLPYQATPGGPVDFLLNVGIPKSLFYGESQPQPGDLFVVIEAPDIKFPAIGG